MCLWMLLIDFEDIVPILLNIWIALWKPEKCSFEMTMRWSSISFCGRTTPLLWCSWIGYIICVGTLKSKISWSLNNLYDLCVTLIKRLLYINDVFPQQTTQCFIKTRNLLFSIAKQAQVAKLWQYPSYS